MNPQAIENAGFLAWDVAGVVIPVLPGSWSAKAAKYGTKLLSKTDNIIDVARWAQDGSKWATKIDNAFSALSKLDNLSVMKKFGGVKNYDELSKLTKNVADVQAHHIVVTSRIVVITIPELAVIKNSLFFGILPDTGKPNS